MFSFEILRGKLVRGRPETFDRCVGISKLALQNYLQPSRLSRNSHSSQKLSCTIHFRIVVLFQPRNSWHDDHRTAQFLTRCTSIYSNRYFYWRCILLGGRQVARSVPFTFSRIGSLQVWSICTNNSDPSARRLEFFHIYVARNYIVLVLFSFSIVQQLKSLLIF